LAVKKAEYMANDAPNYDDATPEQKEEGGWYADNDGLLPDNELAYEYE
jgi:hypothetical protein